MSKYVALFQADLYNSFDEKQEKYYGAVQCNNFSDAMAQVECYFEDELVACHLELIDQEVITFDKDTYDKIHSDAFF